MFSNKLGFDTTVLRNQLEQFKITPFGAVYLSDRWRKSDGLTPNSDKITLGIHFMGGDNAKREAVRTAAPKWLEGDLGNLIAFQFDVPIQKSQIRISFSSQEGNHSLVGRDAARYPGYRTMNLIDVEEPIILHEFGHALALQHEHLHPTSGIVWNEQVVINEMKQRFGWSAQYTRMNILNRLTSEAACVGDPTMDRQSIMMYPIPEHWTQNFSSDWIDHISDRDRKCLIGVYRT
ncbi:MAG: hypothetical protein KF835_12355 [Xanthobacteraceae bacterium]|nr:hypothetical protein [Xanthobacteraceae bacterium]